MKKYAWTSTIKKWKKEDVKRHKEIWQKMVKVLKEAGICNYTILIDDNKLFGYYECKYFAVFAAKIQAKSSVMDKWKNMKDVMNMKTNEQTGAQPRLECVFTLN